MGKLYHFPNKRQLEQKKAEAYSGNKIIIRETMEILIATYTSSIEDLKGYKEGIKKVDGTAVKGPKELLKLVTRLKKLFTEYGIVSNFYRFVTLKDTQILYFNDTKLIYSYKGDKKDRAQGFSIEEFIREFEAYHFTLIIGEEVYNVLDSQINKLEITIETLKNTL